MGAGIVATLISQSSPNYQPPQPTETPALPTQLPPEPVGPIRVPPAPVPPTVHAAAAILVDAASGQVLYERNADVERPMASTTKIMTALLFCEHLPETAIITASPHACSIKESSMHLKPGEKVSAHDLLRAILMRSANDGCVAAGEAVAGSEAAFVAMMNARAASLGCTHTHFANPHGLHDPEHYTTARDLATIARAAMLEPRIREVVGTQRCKIARSINKRDVTMSNHSHFLGHFPGADGIKTGYTVPAGHCYAGSATHKGWELISVVLHSPDYVRETGELMRFGFTHFQPHILYAADTVTGDCGVQGGVKPSVPVRVRSKVQIVLRRGETTPITAAPRLDPIKAPVTVGTPVGVMEARIGDKVICSSQLLAADNDPAVAALNLPSTRRGSPRLLIMASILGLCLVSLRYGTRFTTLTKSARRRRRRLAKSLRGDD